MDAITFSKYIGLFSNLHRHARSGLGYAPHKPILLLAILDEVQRGNITNNFIPITPELVASFRAYWQALVPMGQWRERMFYPFRYLIQDGFWELVKNGASLTAKQLGDPVSINQLNSVIDGGRFSVDLWDLLQDTVAVNGLRSLLLKTYFNTTETDVAKELPTSPIDYEAQKLIAEARSKFRPSMTRERKDDDGYFVRHALFPRVVKSLYDGACAVCDLAVHTDDSGGIVDAAHIMPFGKFHNDDPRNGIAFCKNHHWGFDAGWFAVSADHKVLVSTRLKNHLSYLTSGSPLRLPSQVEYAPAQEALTWHRANKFLR